MAGITYSTEVTEKICLELMLGRTLTKICKMEGMPSYPTIVNWLQKHEEFRKDYEFARNVQYEKMSDDILDISDDSSEDVDPNTGKVTWENINRSRLKVDSRKWLLSHVLPKKYGAKVTQEISGPNGAALNAPMTEQEKFELARLMAFRMTEATRKVA